MNNTPPSTDRNPILLASGVRREYGALVALDAFDLRLDEGECVVIMGPNGCGKTTALSLISGLLDPSSGQVSVRGISVHEEPAAAGARALFATVPDNPLLYEDLTVSDHLELVAVAHGVGGKDLDDRIANLLERLGLTDKSNALPRELSRGMRQKTQLACALIRPFDLLILDEPIAGLDERTVGVLTEILAELTERGAGVLISTHQPGFANAVADRVIKLEEGCVVGDPAS